MLNFDSEIAARPRGAHHQLAETAGTSKREVGPHAKTCESCLKYMWCSLHISFGAGIVSS